ncbi:MAG: hypothetical protein M1835_000559 [Candelina submexicana]|nr:MAG: hypothetical protein M1835_000559 [Candelina submexicana]
MGLTPLEGLPGATRSGSVDPSLVFHYTHNAGEPSPYSSKDMHISTEEDILNKRSGWKALTGTADFGQIASSDDPKCRLAFDILVDRIVGYVGTYFVSLEGKVDALVFAGGIGEKSALLRATITQKCRCLGFYMDVTKNDSPANEVVADIGEQGHNPRILICRTDEQYEMARQCVMNPKDLGHRNNLTSRVGFGQGATYRVLQVENLSIGITDYLFKPLEDSIAITEVLG